MEVVEIDGVGIVELSAKLLENGNPRDYYLGFLFK